MVGREYICFLLYSEDGEDDETTWMKLTTDNMLRIAYVGIPETEISDTVIRAQGGFASSLLTTII
jgi:hypothetical protein